MKKLAQQAIRSLILTVNKTWEYRAKWEKIRNAHRLTQYQIKRIKYELSELKLCT